MNFVRAVREAEQHLCGIKWLLFIVQDYLQPECATYTSEHVKDCFFGAVLVELHRKYCTACILFRSFSLYAICPEAQHIESSICPELESAAVVQSS